MNKGTGAPPSTHGPGGAKPGRAPNGRFATGNKLGVGNPLAGRAAKLRSALLQSVSEADVRSITKALVQAARGGDVAAVKLLLSYTLGAPEAMDVSERLDALESRLKIGGSL